jgi:hypothetical protein
LRPEVPPEVAGIVGRLMAKKPEQRFQTPIELAQALGFALRPSWLRRASSPDADSSHSIASTESRTEGTGPSIERESNNTEAEQKLISTNESSEHAVTAEPTVPESVRLLWREWYDVVQGFLHGNHAGVDEQYYKVLYRSLLEGLRDRSAHTSSSLTELINRLGSLVEPWVALHTFACADRKILAGLWQACKQLDRELASTRKKTPFAQGLRLLVYICLLSFVSGSLFLLKSILSSASVPFWKGIQSHSFLFIVVCLPLAVLGILVFLSRRAQE